MELVRGRATLESRPVGIGLVISTPRIARCPKVTTGLLETTKPTAASAIAGVEKAGILSETTGRRRDRVFACTSCLKRLRSRTDLAE
jgi:hypothetical protein